MIPGKQPPALTLIGISPDASKQAVNMLFLQTHCFTNYLTPLVYSRGWMGTGTSVVAYPNSLTFPFGLSLNYCDLV